MVSQDEIGSILLKYVLPGMIAFCAICVVVFIRMMSLWKLLCNCACGWCLKRRREKTLLGNCTMGHYDTMTPICSSESCPVCLEDFTSRERIVVTPCFHGFHKRCLLQCLETSPNCPMCKAKLSHEV